MSPGQRRVFPLVPRRAFLGTPFGERRSRRRGQGSDVAGARPYVPGDPVSTIDWPASARLSAARGRDEFVVHTHYADEAPRVTLVCDRRPAMGIYEPPLPWLSKRRALAACAHAIADSAVAARADFGYLDAAEGRPHWVKPGSRDAARLRQSGRLDGDLFDAPEDNVERAFEFLARRGRDVPPGTFVFVVSDFLAPLGGRCFAAALAAQWDLVPVVVQDPFWEQSFGDAAGTVVPVLDPATGRVTEVRMRARDVRERREANEERLRTLLGRFARLGVDPVVVGTSDPATVLRAFRRWAERRHNARRSRW
jgi:uncharacterized protein (DUF58 family)